MEELKRALETKDAEAVERLLSPAVVFRSPAVFKPYAGRAATMVFLRAAMAVFEDFRYVRTFTEDAAEDGGRGYVLMFEANVGGRALEGADFVSVGVDGLVTEFRVMVRPMTGLMALAEAMLPRVEGPLAELARDVSAE
jgi:SnoaL-like protein